MVAVAGLARAAAGAPCSARVASAGEARWWPWENRSSHSSSHSSSPRWRDRRAPQRNGQRKSQKGFNPPTTLPALCRNVGLYMSPVARGGAARPGPRDLGCSMARPTLNNQDWRRQAAERQPASRARITTRLGACGFSFRFGERGQSSRQTSAGSTRGAAFGRSRTRLPLPCEPTSVL